MIFFSRVQTVYIELFVFQIFKMISLVICAKYVFFETFFSWRSFSIFKYRRIFYSKIFFIVCSRMQVHVQLVESFCISLNSYLILCQDVFAIVKLDALLSTIFCRNVYKYFCSALRKILLD